MSRQKESEILVFSIYNHGYSVKGWRSADSDRSQSDVLFEVRKDGKLLIGFIFSLLEANKRFQSNTGVETEE